MKSDIASVLCALEILAVAWAWHIVETQQILVEPPRNESEHYVSNKTGFAVFTLNIYNHHLVVKPEHSYSVSLLSIFWVPSGRERGG